MTPATINKFRKAVWSYYRHHSRQLPWRYTESDGTIDPYHILVSEYMLQQTQVERVKVKYSQFLQLFPDVYTLSKAPLSEVLAAWSGLGYNRRAKFLHDAAYMIVKDHSGRIPNNVKALQKLPGIGENTAAAVCVYAFDEPCIFVETNIRTVFFHHFFQDKIDVPDRNIKIYVKQTLPTKNIRQWYWALMDYGTYLKSVTPILHRQSRHYRRQSPFVGSTRQLRGQVLRLLLNSSYSAEELHTQINDKRLGTVLQALETEGLLTCEKGVYCLP